MLEAGTYWLYLGTDSRDAALCGALALGERVTVQQAAPVGGTPDFADWSPAPTPAEQLPAGMVPVPLDPAALVAAPAVPAEPDPEALAAVQAMTDEELPLCAWAALAARGAATLWAVPV